MTDRSDALDSTGRSPLCAYCGGGATLRAPGFWCWECTSCEGFFRSQWHVLRAFRVFWNAAVCVVIGLAVGVLGLHPLCGLLAAPFLAVAAQHGAELWMWYRRAAGDE